MIYARTSDIVGHLADRLDVATNLASIYLDDVLYDPAAEDDLWRVELPRRRQRRLPRHRKRGRNQ